jgi:hypothetical protein
MKRVLIVLFVFLFAVPNVSAQEELKIATVTPAPTPEVNYTLPFPGLLPDSPLYALKATRDRVVSFFISDPVKKAEFDLLQADKRLQAGLFLLSKEKPDIPLAVSTISKGQNYFEAAVTTTAKAKKDAAAKQSNTSVGDLPDKLYNAARKHHELLRNVSETIETDEQKEFTLLSKRAEGFLKTTEQLQKQK